MATSCRFTQKSRALSGIWGEPRGVEAAAEWRRGGWRGLSPRFATQPPRLYHRRRSGTSISSSLFSSTAILRHLSTFVVPLLLPLSVFCLESSALVFRRNTINHFSRSTGVTPPFTPSAILEEGPWFVNDEVLSTTGRMCDLPDDDYREITHVGLTYRPREFSLLRNAQRLVDVFLKQCIKKMYPQLKLIILKIVVNNISFFFNNRSTTLIGL